MLALFISGLAVVATTLLTLARFNLRRWLGYAGFVDVAFTLVLLWLFSGTFSGVVAAAFSGITMSVMLQVLRKVLGCERMCLTRVSWRKGFIRVGWRYYRPSDLTWFGVQKGARHA